MPVPPRGVLGEINMRLELMGGMKLGMLVDNSQSERAIEEELIQVILLTS
jgi:hypothetical protein